MKAYHHLIKGPLITEKSHLQKEAGNKITLKVDVRANKIEIRQAVEEVFKVKVAGVNTCRYEGKKKRLGRYEGKRSDWKKAIITLGPGEKIPFFEGV
ncbi:50S ribosomal protein L23 [Desulfobacca acetoxidans]|uniref:Large ribosomal subunit protein uL23 n=1 Tax=Desulfobacca acetoxidans (strain ATCC 700848 / DSM 11109 / ASRB2) TaxID=880072 RepID=F2NJD7_DESAR|nr:50S ribosomal protein L23 [Desulfobacca acetoxidans]AEB09309.1 Ribosomal protein L25/L23 [Desulfobacca acetoxidans DSM 11109]